MRIRSWWYGESEGAFDSRSELLAHKAISVPYEYIENTHGDLEYVYSDKDCLKQIDEQTLSNMATLGFAFQEALYIADGHEHQLTPNGQEIFNLMQQFLDGPQGQARDAENDICD